MLIRKNELKLAYSNLW